MGAAAATMADLVMAVALVQDIYFGTAILLWLYKQSPHLVVLDNTRENVQTVRLEYLIYNMVPCQNPISFLFLPPYSSGLCLNV